MIYYILSEPKEEKKEAVIETPTPEKIELPRAASRKSFLRLGGNKKSRAPPRPSSSVKRTKSITDSGGELQTKKIDPSDISGPVVSICSTFVNGIKNGTVGSVGVGIKTCSTCMRNRVLSILESVKLWKV